MIIDITAAPGDEITYSHTVAIKDFAASLGHRVDFIDIFNTWEEDDYVKKLESKSPHLARDYRRRKGVGSSSSR